VIFAKIPHNAAPLRQPNRAAARSVVKVNKGLLPAKPDQVLLLIPSCRLAYQDNEGGQTMSPHQPQITISEVQELNGRLIEIETHLEKINRSMRKVQTYELWIGGMVASLIIGSAGVLLGLMIR
jgi:hypothetical protein